jgi:hypothetical protein
MDQAAQHAASWNPLSTADIVFDLRRAQGNFDSQVLVFGGSLGQSSQTFVVQCRNFRIAHLGYFRTDLKMGRVRPPYTRSKSNRSLE